MSHRLVKELEYELYTWFLQKCCCQKQISDDFKERGPEKPKVWYLSDSF